MAEYPGVYIEEMEPPPAIQGVSTSTAGFIGDAQHGPSEPTTVESFADFARRFGDAASTGAFLGDAVRGFFANGGRRGVVVRAERAADGLARLDEVEDVALVVATDEGAPADAVIDHCVRRGRLAVLSAPAPARETSFAACYGPWLDVDGRAVPPVGHVAGLIARTEDARGVAAAPAGEALAGVGGLAGPVPADPRVNAIRDFRAVGRGIVVWGARTLAGDPEWKYVNVRRLFLYLERSIDRGLQWTVFEPNDEPLWAAVRRAVADFLDREWRRGSFAGTTPDRAYWLRCDRATMTQDDIENGRLICEIGIAPIKPAEFVILRIGRDVAPGPPATPGSPPGPGG